MKKFRPTTKRELQALVEKLEINLGDIDTSKITDMSHLFFDSKRTDFTGIEKWNTNNVTDMCYMFHGAIKFNQDISKWGTRKVKDMSKMFAYAKSFNQDISKWDTSSVTDMRYMFAGAISFNQDISKWDIRKVKDMHGMFDKCPISEENKPFNAR